jgi:RecB family exonuclease
MRLSYSGIDLFYACPLSFKYKYIDKIEVSKKGNFFTALGSGVHKVLELFYEYIQTEEPRLEDMYLIWDKIFFEGYTDKNDEEVPAISEDINYYFKDGYEIERLYYSGKNLLKAYYVTNKKKFSSQLLLATEFNFSIDLKDIDVTLYGFIDRIDLKDDGTLEIIDYKTGKTKNQHELNKDLQATIYSYAVENSWKKPTTVSMYYLKNSTKVTTKRSTDDYIDMFETVKGVMKGIEKEEFPAKPGARCTYCYFECEHRKGAKQK